MREELDKKLVEAFPNLYADRHIDKTRSCMCWGFPGDGWFQIIWDLSEKLEKMIVEVKKYEGKWYRRIYQHLKMYFSWLKAYKIFPKKWVKEMYFRNSKPMLSWKDYKEMNGNYWPRASQVKEKLAGLRVYLNSGTKEMYKEINKAEALSEKTCEICGKEGQVSKRGNWYKTICKECGEKEGYKPCG